MLPGHRCAIKSRTGAHGRPQGGKWAHLPPTPLEFEKMTSYAAVLRNTLKFSLAPSALALATLYFSLKPREKTQKFSFAPSARSKVVDFLYGAPKTCRLLKLSVILPPSGKISAGAHVCMHILAKRKHKNIVLQ